MSRYRFSIDWGETFTDFVLVDAEKHIQIRKVPSTFHEPTVALVREIRQFFEEVGISAEDIEAVVMGLSVRLSGEQALECTRQLEQQLRQLGWQAPIRLVTHDGRLVPTAEAKPDEVMHPSRIGGIYFGQFLSQITDRKKLILLKMGGTFTYLALLPGQTDEVALADKVVGERTLPVGGNNYVGLGADQAYTLWQENAGHEPGPAAFGRGGTLPTVTDINIVLGYLNPGQLLDGRLPLDREASRRAVDEAIAQPLGIRTEAAAMQLHQQVVSYIGDAIRELVDSTNDDISSYSLLAFGGNGPVHVTSIADYVGIHQVIVPVAAGVSTALGYLLLLASDAPSLTSVDTQQRDVHPLHNYEQDFRALKGYRVVYYEADLTPCSCPVYDRRRIQASETLSGPGVIEEPETTVVIREKSYVRMDAFRNLLIDMR